jgi:TolB-like protein/Flp pilus assembly protein TadD
MSRLVEELKRRNVFRVGIAYLVAAWLLIQVTDVLAPMLSLPDWASRFIFLLLAVGFLPAVIFAWAYELTPEGVRREREVDRSQSITSVTGRKLDFAIIAMLSLAIVYLVVDNYVFEDVVLPTADSALEKSIAVLPFRNRSNNADDVHFVDGIHDDILTQLAKLATLDKVISRTSTERYRDTELPIPQIGEELGVATILEGGVQRAGSRVRINVQLIDASTDEHLWAETYDHELTVENLFAIQNEVSREIVTALHGVLSDEEAERLEQMPTTSLEAHAEYAFGRREMAKRTGESLLLAQAHFEKAVELDPNYALAWVGLADTRALQVGYLGIPLESTYEDREMAINKALAIDPLLGEAYASLAVLKGAQRQQADQQKYDEVERLYLRAIELSPNYAPAYHWYGRALNGVGRFEEGEVQLRKAIELDPMALVLRASLIHSLMLLGRTDEAREQTLDGVKHNPEFPVFYSNMANLLRSEGRHGEALKWMLAGVRANPTSPDVRSGLCQMYVEIADYDAAERCIDAYEAEMPDTIPGMKAWLLVSRGQHEEGLARLEALLDEGVPPYMKPLYAQVFFFSGEWDIARTLLEETYPTFFDDEEWAPANPHELFYGTLVASVMYADGELERANHLFDRALAAMQSMPRSGPTGYQEIDALIHVVRGEKQRAIAALRDAFKEDAVFVASKYSSPPMATMLDEPEWLVLITEIEAKFSRERQWYEAHKDEPLF